MPESLRTGLLLVNLGTPASPRPADVRRYLREFLSDARVIDLAAWQRWLVLNLFILPFRPRASAEAYAKIWTDQGSPLLVHSMALTEKVRARLGGGVAVELAMRYGEPSIPGALSRLVGMGIDRLVLLPLYPQYSSAATGSTVERVLALATTGWNVPAVQVIPPFFDHPTFLDACAQVVRPTIEQARPERVFFSFHGLPERQVRKSDPGGAHCLVDPSCCERAQEALRYCYRAQCFATAAGLATRLGVPPDQLVVCFQSRLGRDPWIRPYTDEVLIEAARSGVRRAVIASPAFVADCLETIEELGIRGVATWRENGGERLDLAPCLNASDIWVEALVTLAREHSPWLSDAPATVGPRRSPTSPGLAR